MNTQGNGVPRYQDMDSLHPSNSFSKCPCSCPVKGDLGIGGCRSSLDHWASLKIREKGPHMVQVELDYPVDMDGLEMVLRQGKIYLVSSCFASRRCRCLEIAQGTHNRKTLIEHLAAFEKNDKGKELAASTQQEHFDSGFSTDNCNFHCILQITNSIPKSDSAHCVRSSHLRTDHIVPHPRQLSTSIPGRDPLLRVKPPAATRKEQAVTTDQSTDFLSNLRAVTTTTTTTTTTPPAIAAPSPPTHSRSLHHSYTLPPINHRISRRNRRAPRLS